MVLYPFEVHLAIASDAPNIVVSDAEITFYNPTDTALASPLDLVDTYGRVMANPVRATEQGFTPAFQATIPQVMWSGGGYSGYMQSFQGLLDAALANALPPGGFDGQLLGRSGGVPIWQAGFVVIGPNDPWPTDLPEGTLIVRSEV